jgi:hypothetical protein
VERFTLRFGARNVKTRSAAFSDFIKSARVLSHRLENARGHASNSAPTSLCSSERVLGGQRQIITGSLGIDNCLLLEPSTSPTTNLGQAISSHTAIMLDTGHELRTWAEVESLDQV